MALRFRLRRDYRCRRRAPAPRPVRALIVTPDGPQRVGRESVEDYEEAAGRNAYSVTRFTSAYYGCMLEACGASKVSSIFVLREGSSDVWTGGVKD
jgi:hypothetical protein